MKCLRDNFVYADGRRRVYINGYIHSFECEIYNQHPFAVYYSFEEKFKIVFVSGCDIKKATRIAKATLPIKAIKRHLISARIQTHLTMEEINDIITALIDYKRG